MSLTEGTMSPADIAAVTGNNNNDGFMGNGAWWIIILFLFAFNGNWGYGNNGVGAQDNYVLASDFATIQRQLSDGFSGVEKDNDRIITGLCDGFYTNAQLISGVNQNISNTGFAIQNAIQQDTVANLQNTNQLSRQLADCCCQNRYDALQNSMTTNNAIQSGFCQTNYNNASNTRDIIDATNAGTRAILDAIQANKVEELQARIAEQSQTINALQLAASQQAQNAYLVSELAPKLPVAAYQVPNPFTGCGCGCNC